MTIAPNRERSADREVEQVNAGRGDHGVLTRVHPCARIEPEPTGVEFGASGPVGMAQDQEVDGRIGREAGGGPGFLPRHRRVEHGFVTRAVGEARAQGSDQGHSEIGVEEAKRGHEGPTPGQAMDQAGSPVLLGETISMPGFDAAARGLEPEKIRVKLNTHVPFPERAAPAIVVAARQQDRDPSSQPGKGPGHTHSRSRHDAPPGEPEVEEISIDEETIAEGGGLIQEVEEGGFHRIRNGAEMRVGKDDQLMPEHDTKIGRQALSRHATPSGPVTGTTVRVNYSETDQMGVVYHARYAVWLDIARTEHLRSAGMSYADLEARGFRLAVLELEIQYRHPARFDDLIEVRCWVTECASRRVTFAYDIRLRDTGTLLGTARTPMIVLDAAWRPVRLPPDAAALLPVSGGPDA